VTAHQVRFIFVEACPARAPGIFVGGDVKFQRRWCSRAIRVPRGRRRRLRGGAGRNRDNRPPDLGVRAESFTGQAARRADIFFSVSFNSKPP